MNRLLRKVWADILKINSAEILELMTRLEDRLTTIHGIEDDIGKQNDAKSSKISKSSGYLTRLRIDSLK
jgi:hypothetical protein